MATTYEYPQVQEGRHYEYCSQLEENTLMKLETSGDEWTTTKAKREYNKC